MKYLFYIGTRKYSLSTEEDLLKISPGDLSGKKEIVIGSQNLIHDVQRAYRKLFQKAVDQYNLQRQDKPISSYYCKINESKKLSLATGILIRLGKKEEWENILDKDKKKIEKLYQNQLEVIKEFLPDFHIVNATIYLEEPCLRIVGIPIKREKEEKKKLSIHICKSACFDKTRIEELRKHLVFQIKSDFLKLYYKEIEVTRMIQERKKKKQKQRKITEKDYRQLELFQ
ncbi:hypothetical protein HMPREF1049_1596 [Fusobacterium necrophorum subsp. funduliforme ATCC 51357]|uniref:Uncharacterized protein n=1 Tax=Fusobacterium gonidiaformans 3-1-5R TaxID=469605 RepID=E5BI16_9FUSO|nr:MULTISPECIES: hypothetical protein [Fusobacterium]EFS22139.1 hypothetical protein FSBG_01636 [Fusobacterium gonidiaformans 3-1-5R]EFS22922.2 hypothetical protein FSEG_00529 [Fusobacterium necrophorum D12]EIJ72415.1 hypothetical protein HMPREF1049_1596 [Fusobacterium necrophorum subsp. funduliforme ATCC 51357]KAB0552933.1 hypothetical protein F7P76_06105 [Fusobacterium necrophorum subsp. funduliforme]